MSLPLIECKEKHFPFALMTTSPQLASPICSMNLGAWFSLEARGAAVRNILYTLQNESPSRNGFQTILAKNYMWTVAFDQLFKQKCKIYRSFFNPPAPLNNIVFQYVA